jgi:BirA family biotin operon repressor/biotin-[acetyl-CoA-carboxylase] ligase
MTEGALKWDIIRLGEIGSTNTELKAMARDGAPEGTVLVADSQTGGRGRLGRSWHSDGPWGLWVSVLLRPRIEAERAPFLGMLMALAAARAVRKLSGLEAGIKWPNDVEVGGFKVAGILPEAGTGPSGLQWVVIGLGINLAAPLSSFPEELKGRASSIGALAGIAPTRDSVLDAVLGELGSLYPSFLSGEDGKLIAEINSISTIDGKRITVFAGESSYPATALRAEPSGALIVMNDEGKLISLLSGEVSIRRS